MSQENVKIVRASIDAWNRGDWDATLKDGAPSFEFDFSRSVGPGRAVYSLDQMRGFFHEFVESWESNRIEADEFIEVETMPLSGDTGQTLVAYSAPPGSAAADSLTLLAGWAASNGDPDPVEADKPHTHPF